MHRRKLDQTNGARRGNWLASRASYRVEGTGRDPKTSTEESTLSHTDPASTVSSGTLGVEGFAMPNWEQPGDMLGAVQGGGGGGGGGMKQPPPPPSPPRRRSIANGSREAAMREFSSRGTKPPLEGLEMGRHPSTPELPHPGSGSDPFENMVVSCNDTASLEDDITFFEGEFDDLSNRRSSLDAKRQEIKRRAGPPREERRARTSSTGSLGSDDSKTVEEQEEEMVRLAVQRSLSESSSRVGAVSMASTATPVVKNAAGSQPKFMWKKGANNRYCKVPIGLNNLGSVNEEEAFANSESLRDTSSVKSGSAQSDARLDRIEQDMIQEAMERSMAEKPRKSDKTQLSQAEIDQEAALIEIALQRSLQESESPKYDYREARRRAKVGDIERQTNLTLEERKNLFNRGASEGLPAEADVRIGFLHEPPKSVSRNPSSDSISAARASGKNFIWKKGPNNRYYKHYIDDDPEPDEGQPQDEEARMLAEAMQRSMRQY